MRVMYDAVTAANIPQAADMVAGYVDGRYAWKQTDWARFPKAVKVRIAVFSETNDGHVLDVEPGNATPVEAVHWVKMRRAAGVIPTVYCGASQWQECKQAFLNAGEPEPLWWIAQWNAQREIPLGAVAKQYVNMENYDLSVVADFWPGVDELQETTTSTAEAAVNLVSIPHVTPDEMRKIEAGIAKVQAEVAALTIYINSLTTRYTL